MKKTTQTLKAIQAHACWFLPSQVFLLDFLLGNEIRNGVFLFTLMMVFALPLAAVGFSANILKPIGEEEVRQSNLGTWIAMVLFVLVFSTLACLGPYIKGFEVFTDEDGKNILFFSLHIGATVMITFGTVLMRYMIAYRSERELLHS